MGKNMRKHDEPVCYLSLPSTKQDAVVKVLMADAYRALADHISASVRATVDKETVRAIRKYRLLSDLIMESVRFDAAADKEKVS